MEPIIEGNKIVRVFNFWTTLLAALTTIAVNIFIFLSSKSSSEEIKPGSFLDANTIFIITVISLSIILILLAYRYMRLSKRIRTFEELKCEIGTLKIDAGKFKADTEKLKDEEKKLINECTSLKLQIKMQEENFELEKNEYNQKITEMDKLISELQICACQGLKPLENNVKVTFDTINKIYKLKFEKKLIVLSEKAPQWYNGQFYCNRYLTDRKEARKFYKENPVIWEKLNFKAFMEYEPCDEEREQSIRLRVENINDNFNYILYKLQFAKYDGEDSDTQSYITIEKGTTIYLSYSYEISPELWGSFLNRSLSVFGESASVTFAYPEDFTLNEIGVSLHTLSPIDGKPSEIPLKFNKIKEKRVEDGVKNATINLNNYKGHKKFRLYWDSEKLFGIPKTINGTDDAKLTEY